MAERKKANMWAEQEMWRRIKGKSKGVHSGRMNERNEMCVIHERPTRQDEMGGGGWGVVSKL